MDILLKILPKHVKNVSMDVSVVDLKLIVQNVTLHIIFIIINAWLTVQSIPIVQVTFLMVIYVKIVGLFAVYA